MKGLIVKDYSRVDLKNPEHVRKLMGAFQHFMQGPERDPRIKAGLQASLRGDLQAFTTKGDFPAELLPLIEKYRELPTYDTEYENIFDIKDFRSTQANGFEISNVRSGLQFGEVKTGEKAKVWQFSGDKAQIFFSLYGGGLNWDNTLFQDAQWVEIEDRAMMMMAAYYATKAQSHYDLIDAVASSQNVAWQNPLPSGLPATDALYAANRDAQTINTACAGIISDLKDKGFPVSVNTPFTLLAPHTLQGRIAQAMTYQAQNLSGTPRSLFYNVTPRYTAMLSDATKYYICLPKGKSKGGNRMDLSLQFQDDILAYAGLVVGWARWGAAIGEVKQFRRCSIS